MKAKWILYFFLMIGTYFQLKYRFKHPEQTETQLFINFFQAFKE